VRTYGQHCPLAKTLDVMGDRWSLLIVRELMIHGPSRYTDLRNGLPGIATNLLADRLRELEQAGVIRRDEAPPPIATALFRLTPRGDELRDVVKAMAQWGIPLLLHALDQEGEEFHSRWLGSPVTLYMTDTAPDRPPITIQVNTGDEPMLIETIGGAVRARPGHDEHADAVLSGPPRPVIALITGRIGLAEAKAAGVGYTGNLDALRRIQPGVAATA